MLIKTYTTTSADGNLNCVSSRLTHLLQVQRTMCVLVLATINFEWCRICRHLNTRRPICVHLTVLVMETLELQLEIGSTHERIVNGRFQLKYVIADGQIVFEPKRWQYYAIAHRKC